MVGRSQVIVLADTHLRDTEVARRDLPAALWTRLARCDLILHAGDVVEAGLLQRLGDHAPTVAVLGNNDHALRGTLPETYVSTVGGVPLAMVHDSGARAGRPGRLRRRFPRADLVVFGHSHVPVDETGIDGQMLFNPGSPTSRRGDPRHTYGELLLTGGRIVEHRIVDLGS